MEISDEFHKLAALPHRKEPPYLFDGRQGGLQSWSGHCVENIRLPLLGIKRRPSSLSLYRLGYPGSFYEKKKHFENL
jgi:hypothetical protein